MSIMKPLFWSGLLAVDLLVPDPLPFLDEAFLGYKVLTSWDEYFSSKKVQPLNYGSCSRWRKKKR